ncbi:uncharacterized protein MYCFIDRAFT_179729 [Pseudocercospora fijiensis CIRAD86]|uniref:Uncharacterized protein n=1 Tax=Pseudocercospora fijiensis (strain CIRAD86) TaxID=383855 RepID=M3AJZ5_PSEFD|nr:uncharacterized protein MYCFIDRAFT_179729 [Pseudocercospora fijiensis CIRAD86]EME77498.1 hypothetical protein MYCFIDRAFT_179729 [Pseudocercospora fijiensis CIRAD86]
MLTILGSLIMPRQRNQALPYSHEVMNSRLDEMKALGTVTPTDFNRFYLIALHHDKLAATQDPNEQRRRHNLVYRQFEAKFKERYSRKPTWSSSRASFLKEAVDLFLLAQGASASPSSPMPPLKSTALHNDAPVSDVPDVPDDSEHSVSITTSQMSPPASLTKDNGGRDSHETWTSLLTAAYNRVQDDPTNQQHIDTYATHVKQYSDWLMARENEFHRLCREEDKKYHSKKEELKTRELLRAKQEEVEKTLDQERRLMAKQQEMNTRAQSAKEKNAKLGDALDQSRIAEKNLTEDLRNLRKEKDLAEAKARELQSQLHLKQDENFKLLDENTALKQADEKNTKSIESSPTSRRKTLVSWRSKQISLTRSSNCATESSTSNRKARIQQVSNKNSELSALQEQNWQLQQASTNISKSHNLLEKKLSTRDKITHGLQERIRILEKDQTLLPSFIPAHVQARVAYLKANGSNQERLEFRNEVMRLAGSRQLSAASIEKNLELRDLVGEVVEVLEGVGRVQTTKRRIDDCRRSKIDLELCGTYNIQ